MSEDLTRADSELLKLRVSIHAAVGNDCQIQHRLDEFEAAVEKRTAEWLRTQGARTAAAVADTLDPDADGTAPPWRPSRSRAAGLAVAAEGGEYRMSTRTRADEQPDDGEFLDDFTSGRPD